MGILGGLLGVGGSVWGGSAMSKAIKNAKRNLEQRKEANESWFNRRYNEDATQRADAQRLLGITRENIRNRNRAAAGAQAIVGGTDASLENARAANNAALSDVASRIAVAGNARKDSVESAYLNRRDSLDDSLNDIELKRADEIKKAAQGVVDATAEMTDFL